MTGARAVHAVHRRRFKFKEVNTMTRRNVSGVDPDDSLETN
jgi:hypothetical protein